MRSNFAMPPWNCIPSHGFSSRSNRTPRMPVGASGFRTGTANSVTAAGSRIELAEDLLAEAGVPRDAGRVDDDVVRLPGLVRQVVLGIDDLRRLPRRPRRRLERIAPLRSGAQIERRQVLGLPAPRRAALFGGLRTGSDARRRQFLDLQRERQLRIRRHPLDDGDHPVRVVVRPDDPLHRVTVRAAADRSLLRVGAGKAREPVGVRQLRGEVFGLL